MKSTETSQPKTINSPVIQKALSKVAENNLLPKQGSRIAVAMSGGVDSSVAAALIKALGYETLGVTAWLMEGSGKCCDGGMLDSAYSAESLGIEHQSLDLRELFARKIIEPFVSSYSRGLTPVPCMPCNTEIKWGSLLSYIETLGCSHLASGHYARLNSSPNDKLHVARPSDESKDQSYMLWGLNQKQLAHTVFPLANFTKTEIRELAQAFGLAVWDKEESQDICFVPNKTSTYLREKLGEKTGEIRAKSGGALLGEHTGTHFFTVGQRKGIGLSSEEPLYVVELDPIKNIVYVGGKSELLAPGLKASGAVWQQQVVAEEFQAQVKYRYNSPPALATVRVIGEGKSFLVHFAEPQMSLSPGQAVVLYDLDYSGIIGGAWIETGVMP